VRIRLPDPAHPRIHAAAVHTAAVIGAVLISAGCSGGGAGGSEAGKPAAQILSDAQASAQAADSVHISGTIARSASTLSPSPAPATTATIDLVLTSSGDGREQITGAGQNIDLIKVGPTLYVKGLTAPGATAGYQRLSATDSRAAPLVAQLDKKAVFAQLIKTGDTAAVTGSATVNGQPAVKITPSSGVGVLYVADDATHPYPLKVETSPPASAATGAAQPTAAAGPTGALMFTDWNAHTVISAPPNGGN